jgi:glutathione S-transferase
MITIYVFGNVPSPVVGATRDLRVLWAAEEAGLAYRVHPLDQPRGDLRSPDYLRVNPFGLVPAIDDQGFKLFESAAIVRYLAEKAGKLLPADQNERALATQWAFAAATTIEPKLLDVFLADKFHADAAWAQERRPALVEAAHKRLADLDGQLTKHDYLLGRELTVPDILMCSALRLIQHTNLLDARPNISRYKERCESRPAWRKVYAAYAERLAA